MRVLETLAWGEIAAAVGGRLTAEPSRRAVEGSIDTRTLAAGAIFFALPGERVDGHEYLRDASAKGAACAVVEDPSRAPLGLSCLVVDDPARALFEIGRLVRSRTTARIVAITGSAGKTTTKEFTAALLRTQGPLLATTGNLNNHLGVPLTLLRLETEHRAAVIECGMSHAGELSALSGLLRPDIAVVTNAAAAHLEFFASVDDIARAKAEIYEGLGARGVALAPADDPRLVAAATAATAPDRTRLFGSSPDAVLNADIVSMSIEGTELRLTARGRGSASVRLQAPGAPVIANFLAAATIAIELGVPLETIAALAGQLKSSSNRGGVKRLQDDIVLIDDSYNSNPLALLAAVDTLALARDRRRVACVGDMLELGPQGPALHRSAGVAIACKVDVLLGAGALGKEIVEGASALPPGARRAFASSMELAAGVSDVVRAHDAVLVKGSRGARMERVVDALVAAHPQVQA